MTLAIDVGNTHIVVGCIHNNNIRNVFRLSTSIHRTAEEYSVQLSNILTFHDINREEITGVALSSVVPPLTGVINEAVQILIGLKAIVVGAGIKTGMNILIDNPAELGADIVATSVGALAYYEPPIILVDMGTATKIFVLNKMGSLIGGAILPGMALSANSLARGASQLPNVPLEAPAKSISTNTIECMKSGIVLGTASAIDGMIERFEEELGESAQIVATGGLSETVYRHCKREIIHDPDLILRGLNLIFEKNKKAK